MCMVTSNGLEMELGSNTLELGSEVLRLGSDKIVFGGSYVA